MPDRSAVSPQFRRTARAALLLSAGLAATASFGAAARPAMTLPQTWSGRSVIPEGMSPGLTADRFEIRVSTLSPDEEIMRLGSALRLGGQVGMRNEMFRIPSKGWIRFGKLVATEINVVRVVDLPDGNRRLRLISDHPLRLYDKSDPPGSDKHPFGYIELIVDPSGTGTGLLIAAASLELTEEGLKLDSAGAPVVAIEEVHTDAPPSN